MSCSLFEFTVHTILLLRRMTAMTGRTAASQTPLGAGSGPFYAVSDWTWGYGKRVRGQQLVLAADEKRVDQIVVYKIDRITQSLADFVKLIDRLDTAQASFASVTQCFNTPTSMGRLMRRLCRSTQINPHPEANFRVRVAVLIRNCIWVLPPQTLLTRS